MNTNQSPPFQKLYSHLNPQNQKQKTTETHFDEKDFNITASSKVIIPSIYKPKKQSEQNTTASKTASSSSQSGTSKSNNQQEKSRSRLKTRKTSRDNSKSPKPKEKPNVKLTRLQDQSIKTTNKYGHLESMES